MLVYQKVHSLQYLVAVPGTSYSKSSHPLGWLNMAETSQLVMGKSMKNMGENHLG